MRKSIKLGTIVGKVKIIKLLANSKKFTNRRGNLYECICIQCGKTKKYQSSAINRKGFKGCRCPKDLTLASKKSWYKTYKDNANKRGLSFELSFEDFIQLCEKPCHYTGKVKTILINITDLHGHWECNGVDRIDNNLGYTKDNVVPCSKQANRMKGVLTKTEFLSVVESIHNHLKL